MVEYATPTNESKIRDNTSLNQTTSSQLQLLPQLWLQLQLVLLQLVLLN